MKIYENLGINNLENEIWKVIEDFPDYSVSNLGRVKSFKHWRGLNYRLLTLCKNKKGYLQVKLSNNRKYKTKQIHILVFETFCCKLKNNDCVHHIDFIKENNYYDNLIIMPKKEHDIFHSTGENNSMFGKHRGQNSKNKQSITMKNKFRNGELNQKGENSNFSKLKEWQVKAIYQIANSPIIKKLKITQKEIGEIFGIKNNTVSEIKNKKIWNHIL